MPYDTPTKNKYDPKEDQTKTCAPCAPVKSDRPQRRAQQVAQGGAQGNSVTKKLF